LYVSFAYFPAALIEDFTAELNHEKPDFILSLPCFKLSLCSIVSDMLSFANLDFSDIYVPAEDIPCFVNSPTIIALVLIFS